MPRSCPTARDGFGAQVVDALHLVVINLRHGGVRLVAAWGTVAFVLKVNGREFAAHVPIPSAQTSGDGRQMAYTLRTSSGISIHLSWLTSCWIAPGRKWVRDPPGR